MERHSTGFPFKASKLPWVAYLLILQTLCSRNLKSGTQLPFLKMLVSEKGVTISSGSQNSSSRCDFGPFPIDCISYGVQDLVYTRVFAMIVVRESIPSHHSTSTRPARGATAPVQNPFECYAFVCDSRQNARRLTFALAKAFQEFSKAVKTEDGNSASGDRKEPKQFAIDLRTREQIEEDMKNDLDSEA